MKYSQTIAGAIAQMLAFLATFLQVDLPYTPEDIEQAIIVIVGIGGFLITYIGRIRHNDVDLLGRKK